MLQVFRSLPIVREVHSEGALPLSAASYSRDTITLGWEERTRGRARRRSDGGVEFGAVLPRGTVLKAGDCFVVDQPGVVVAVVEQVEPVLVVVPRTAEEWGLLSYFIGNSHQPMMIAGSAIVCPDVAGMEQVLNYHRIPYEREVRSFTPVSVMGGLAGSEHAHQPLNGSLTS